VLVVTAVCCALIMLQPNLGTTVLVATMVMVVLWVAGARGPLLAGLGLGGVALAVGLAITEPYRFARLTAFVDPWADPLGGGYQTLQSQAAIANGGLTGLGLGQGRSIFGFLPEGHTDFIFSNISEEFGLIGSLLTIGLFVAIAVLGGMIALRAPDRFGMLLAAGITTWVTLQAVVNLGVAVGVLPITGVPLPLVSAGGSSLVVTMVACGLLMNVARRAS
jgi:cell division protein FtsW